MLILRRSRLAWLDGKTFTRRLGRCYRIRPRALIGGLWGRRLIIRVFIPANLFLVTECGAYSVPNMSAEGAPKNAGKVGGVKSLPFNISFRRCSSLATTIRRK